MKNTNGTLWGSYLQTCSQLNKTPVINLDTTLNHKFSIHSAEDLNPGEMPVTKYIAIGNGGINLNSQLGTQVPEPVGHQPDSVALYNHIPFLVREASNDISGSEQQRYRMRKQITVNGVQYIAYYLRVLDISNSTPTLVNRTITNSSMVTSNYTPDIAEIVTSPTPPVNLPSTPNQPTTEFVSVTTEIPFNLTSDEVNDIKEACSTLYGNVNHAVISEIGIYSGVDRTLSGSGGNYTEVVVAQPQTFMSTLYSLTVVDTKLSITIHYGDDLGKLT